MNWQKKAEWLRAHGYKLIVSENSGVRPWCGEITADRTIQYWDCTIPDVIRVLYLRGLAHWETTKKMEIHEHKWEWDYLEKLGWNMAAGMVCECGAKLHLDDVEEKVNR